MVINARQRSPLGAPYRTPLGAFGQGGVAPVPQFSGEVVGVGENLILTPIASPCGIQAQPGGSDTLIQINLFNTEDPDVSWADYIVNFSGKLYQGNQSGLQARFGGVYQSPETFCQVGGQATIWVPGLTADIAAGYQRIPAQEWAAYSGPNPGWIVGETVTLLE